MSSTAFVNGSTLSDAGWANDVDTFVYSRLTSVSGTNTIVGTGPVSMTAYAAGQRFTFIPAATNTGATTLNITPSGSSALGAKNIYFNGAALAGGEIVLNVPVEVFYDGTQFNIVGPTLDETYTAASAACTGAITPTVIWSLRRSGKNIVLKLPVTNGTAGASPSFSYGTAIPAKFRPSADAHFAVPMKNNGAYQSSPGAIFISSSTGIITGYRLTDFASNFTAGANAGGDYEWHVSWAI